MMEPVPGIAAVLVMLAGIALAVAWQRSGAIVAKKRRRIHS